jgi:hypothetical protein
VKELQKERQREIDHLKDKIAYGDNCSNDYKENTEKRFLYTEGYLNHNADHMDKEAFENAKIKQEHRKEQLDNFRLKTNINHIIVCRSSFRFEVPLQF